MLLLQKHLSSFEPKCHYNGKNKTQTPKTVETVKTTNKMIITDCNHSGLYVWEELLFFLLVVAFHIVQSLMPKLGSQSSDVEISLNISQSVCLYEAFQLSLFRDPVLHNQIIKFRFKFLIATSRILCPWRAWQHSPQLNWEKTWIWMLVFRYIVNRI